MGAWRQWSGVATRWSVAFAAGLILALPCSAEPMPPARKGLQWGANGHPFTAYPGVPFGDQISSLTHLGLTSYRVNVSSLHQLPALQRLTREAAAQGVSILPVLTPSLSLADETPEHLYRESRRFALALATPLRDQIPVWELGNELENFAIIKACERKDDGSQYNCSWGPAGGVGVDEYYTPRWIKVSAVLRGLSDGIAEGAPGARRAIGTAGWGHLGAFERMRRDGIAWDISVWHLYSDDPQWAFTELQKYGKPIWVTEFSDPLSPGPIDDGARKLRLRRLMDTLASLAARYRVEAAFLYELLDEPYWGNTPEAHYGLLSLKRSPGGWALAAPSATYSTVQAVTGGHGFPPGVCDVRAGHTPDGCPP